MIGLLGERNVFSRKRGTLWYIMAQMIHYGPNGTLNSGIIPHPRLGTTCHFRVIIPKIDRVKFPLTSFFHI